MEINQPKSIKPKMKGHMQVLKHGCQLRTTDISVLDTHHGGNTIINNFMM
jgi:hypothetical protein